MTRALGLVAVALAAAACASSPAKVAPSPAPVDTSEVTPKPTPPPTPAVTLTPMPVAEAPLAGRTVVLDPGHNALNSSQPRRANAPVPAGGFTKPCNTSGTSTDEGYPEHAYAFDVAIRAAALLRSQGARVVLTRPDDRGFGPCVNERAAVANRAHADLTISIHADGGPASGYGFHLIEPGVAPDGSNRAILVRSATLALALRSAFRAATGEPYATYTAHDGLDRRTDLAGLNLARVPAVFIECGNMRNAGDARRLKSTAFRQSAARGVDQAVLAFLRR